MGGGGSSPFLEKKSGGILRGRAKAIQAAGEGRGIGKKFGKYALNFEVWYASYTTLWGRTC